MESQPQEFTPAPGRPHSEDKSDQSYLHTRWSGAYGTFIVTHDVSAYTSTRVFSEVGKRTRVSVRFGMVGAENDATDTERNMCGFAVTFHSDEGNWEIAGSNLPVFSVNDPQKFSDFVHTPPAHLKSPTMLWDYWSQTPESLHQVMMLMSDRGLPQSYRFMNGYGVHTFSFINANGERFWAKIRVKSAQGIEFFADTEKKAKGIDFAQRDLAEAIDRGEFPRWSLKVQVMPEAEATTYRYDPFDLTNVWPHIDYPLIDVGVVELNEKSGFLPNSFADAAVDTRFSEPAPNPDYPTPVWYERPAGRADDPYSQPGDLFRRVMKADERRRLVANVVASMNSISGPNREIIIDRQLCHWFRCDIALGMAIAQGLGVDMANLRRMMTGQHG
ncbi:catalase [Spirosoma montaniterrae]|uniref:catalase n=1 Tax=Spirosoma montaniterrae TaxID=1178516 RepID=A0A1P9WW63_9BACT|nr:catalase [Spirosoma montaniterrae]AQG79627.1 hypothetical protein AWR27_09985 [Spirosoma montaniterrae]